MFINYKHKTYVLA